MKPIDFTLPWIETFTGRIYYPTAPSADDICIEDIAHHLSMECRFAGACSKFYSVAEHSVYVSQLVPPEHALTALLHDAPEAYIKDMPRPLKLALPDYKSLERLNWLAVAAKFDLPATMPDEIKVADNAMLLAEREQLMPNTGRHWRIPGTPAQIWVRAVRPENAERMFLDRFTTLALAG